MFTYLLTGLSRSISPRSFRCPGKVREKFHPRQADLQQVEQGAGVSLGRLAWLNPFLVLRTSQLGHPRQSVSPRSRQGLDLEP